MRADTLVCPYNDDDAMDVVRHNDIFVQLDGSKFGRDRLPPAGNHSSGVVQTHAITDDLAEQTLASLSTDRDKIGRRFRIVVSGKAHCASTITSIVRHFMTLL